MPYKITFKKILAENPRIVHFKVQSPLVARKVLPGQFVILRAVPEGERIPLTVVDKNKEEGTIDLIFQEVGRTTKLLGTFSEGEQILDVVGPLGKPSEIKNFGEVVAIGGGVGTAVLYPEVRALKEVGNYLTTIIGAQRKDLLILIEELKKFSDRFFITTDDGSFGMKGLVTDKLKEILNESKKPDLVLAIGPVPMMRAVSELTRPFGIRTLVSLNPIMVDGTGMCGACRCGVGGKTKFVCVDGPEFDGHQVDFEELEARQKTYLEEEKIDLGNLSIKVLNDKPQENFLREVKFEEKTQNNLPVKMPEQPAEQRIKNFSEVALGLTAEEAKKEAQRCLQCKNPLCVKGCPVGIDIPGFIKKIAEGDPVSALKIIKEKNNLPAVCGRVCPQEDQCEKACVLNRKNLAVKIGYLERYAADFGKEEELRPRSVVSKKNKKVAVIGSGPAGLTVAADLAKLGYQVTIFESLNEPGGVLIYGIPEFRLPKTIVHEEVEYIKNLGVEVCLNVVVGKTFTIEDLKNDGYEAFFIGSGAGLPSFMNIPGENLNGVYSANEFLTRVNLMKAYKFPEYHTPVKLGKKVAVIGAGNVAMDAARCALRLGAEEVAIVYRRTEAEMPARLEEIIRAKQEGIQFKLLTLPIRLIGENGWVKEMICQKMKLGEPDKSGRPSPVPVPGSEFGIPVDEVIVAIGQKPNPLLLQAIPGLNVSKRGTIVVDEKGATNIPGIFAGGDITTGAATVISAMGAGKIAALAIDEYLSKSSH